MNKKIMIMTLGLMFFNANMSFAGEFELKTIDGTNEEIERIEGATIDPREDQGHGQITRWARTSVVNQAILNGYIQNYNAAHIQPSSKIGAGYVRFTNGTSVIRIDVRNSQTPTHDYPLQFE